MQFQYDRVLLRGQLNVYHIVCRIGKNGDTCDIIKRYRYGFAIGIASIAVNDLQAIIVYRWQWPVIVKRIILLRTGITG